MFLGKEIQPVTWVFIVIIGIFILSLLVVGILKFIQIVRKQVKRNKKSKKVDQNELLDLFGGKENIVDINIKLNTVSIKVIDKTKVKFDDLKALNIGCQIIGNIIKCSSNYLAEGLKDVKVGE